VEIYCYSLWGNDIFPTMQTFPTMPITNVRLSTQCTVYKRTHTYTGKFIFCLCIALDIKIAILRQFGQKMFLRQQIGLTPSNIAFTMFVSVCSNLRVSRVYLEIRLLLFGNVSVFSVSSKVKLLIKTCN